MIGLCLVMTSCASWRRCWGNESENVKTNFCQASTFSMISTIEIETTFKTDDLNMKLTTLCVVTFQFIVPPRKYYSALNSFLQNLKKTAQLIIDLPFYMKNW